MSWIPDLTAALPARRDDEPPELRRRIIAEVRDHLECAFQRELLLTGDADEAIRRVREKFGDPVQLVPKLWFEALREKIMSQRLMLVCVGMLTAACMAMGVFSWKTAEQSALATQALVARLDQLVSSAETQKSLDWVDVKIKLITEDGDAAPPEGMLVQLTDSGAQGAWSIDVRQKSPVSGEMDFGLLHPGRYNLTINAPWGESLSKLFFVRAGKSPWVETVICPPGPFEEVKVQFDIDWPDDLKQQRLGLLFAVTSSSRQFGEEFWFRHGSTTVDFDGKSNSVLTHYLADTEGNVTPYSSEDRGGTTTSMSDGSCLTTLPRSATVLDQPVTLRGLHQSAFIGGVVLLSRETTSRFDNEMYPTAVFVPLFSSDEDQIKPQDLKVAADRVNHCRLPLPERLIAEVRRKLQEKPEGDFESGRAAQE